MKPFSVLLAAMMGIVLLLPPSIKAQQDTSSYFPLGLWGIWIDHGRPPFSRPLEQQEWFRELTNWEDINANYMVAWIPVWVEDTVMTQTEPIGYKLDIGRSTYGYPGQVDTSLRAWIHQASNPPGAVWKRRAGEKIRGIFQTLGNRSGFYSYFCCTRGGFLAIQCR